MKYAKKMMLVEYPMPSARVEYNNAFGNLNDFFVKPVSNVLYNLDAEMRRILKRSDLTDREKWYHYNKTLQRYLQHVQQKRIDASERTTDNIPARAETPIRTISDDDDESDVGDEWMSYYTPPPKTNTDRQEASTSGLSHRPTSNDESLANIQRAIQRKSFAEVLMAPSPIDLSLQEEEERQLNKRRRQEQELIIARPKYSVQGRPDISVSTPQSRRNPDGVTGMRRELDANVSTRRNKQTKHIDIQNTGSKRESLIPISPSLIKKEPVTPKFLGPWETMKLTQSQRKNRTRKKKT